MWILIFITTCGHIAHTFLALSSNMYKWECALHSFQWTLSPMAVMNAFQKMLQLVMMGLLCVDRSFLHFLTIKTINIFNWVLAPLFHSYPHLHFFILAIRKDISYGINIAIKPNCLLSFSVEFILQLQMVWWYSSNEANCTPLSIFSPVVLFVQMSQSGSTF